MSLSPVRERLPNGVTVIGKETKTTSAVTILAGMRAGALLDPPGAEGTAALVARVLDRGTRSRTAEAIADDLDGRGASLSIVAGRHQVSVSATCLAEDFDDILTLVSDVIREPAFPDVEVETRRSELVTSIRQDEDDPATQALDTLMADLYASHPYGRRGRGTVASVEALTRPQLVDFHRTWFGPAGLILVVAGDVPASDVIASAAKAFAPWRHERPLDPPLTSPNGGRSRRLRVVPMMNKSQTDVAYGLIGIRRSDPEYYATWVMNNALGQYALGGRLGDSIRERQGMAYYVYSSLDASVAAGPLLIRAGVAASNVERTIASIDTELRSLRANGLTATELDESKQYLIGSLPRQLETNSGIAGFLLTAEIFDLGMDFDEHLPDLIAGVSLEAANAAVTRLLDPDRATVVVAGPWEGPSA
jgi:zinc protease